MTEIWKPINFYEGLYEVSNLSRIKSIRKNKEYYLTKRTNEKNYERVTLCKDGIHKTYKVSRLVATAFIPNPENKPEVDHIDTNRKNSIVELDNDGNIIYTNLRWVTHKENCNNPLTRIHNSECQKKKNKVKKVKKGKPEPISLW